MAFSPSVRGLGCNTYREMSPLSRAEALLLSLIFCALLLFPFPQLALFLTSLLVK